MSGATLITTAKTGTTPIPKVLPGNNAPKALKLKITIPPT